ncbi:Uncharacterized protein APZ42_019559 [Daphnia magna]|uniref:Uncharacterized protein n=1 Tax=Daphnia magna TaxID=35525 RepID=A0A164Y9D3_9CRUS|nr:Uncharacterized protein APZ42_019559 [Daphnia magna]
MNFNRSGGKCMSRRRSRLCKSAVSFSSWLTVYQAIMKSRCLVICLVSSCHWRSCWKLEFMHVTKLRKTTSRTIMQMKKETTKTLRIVCLICIFFFFSFFCFLCVYFRYHR